MSGGVFFEGKTSLRILNDMGFKYDKMINDKRFALTPVCVFLFYNTNHACRYAPILFISVINIWGVPRVLTISL